MTITFDELLSQIDNVLQKKRVWLNQVNRKRPTEHSCIIANHEFHHFQKYCNAFNLPIWLVRIMTQYPNYKVYTTISNGELSDPLALCESIKRGLTSVGLHLVSDGLHITSQDQSEWVWDMFKMILYYIFCCHDNSWCWHLSNYASVENFLLKLSLIEY